jgi:isopentenyl diphosphate isomerase/L-lactate dehydrogenase-like FMN-dependent dehydrogenase
MRIIPLAIISETEIGACRIGDRLFGIVEPSSRSSLSNRRNLLRFLAGSPLAARALWAQQSSDALNSPADALKLMDFAEPARRLLPPGHYGQLSSGVDDDQTLKTNLEAFKHIQLRPRRLVDVSKTDLRIEIFGATWDTPIYLCPLGGQKAYHPEGEVAVARAARARKTMQVLSTATSSSVEDVAQGLGTPPWYQLYMPASWDATEKLVRRVEAAGCPALAWTVDLLGGRNLLTFERLRRTDPRPCTMCHGPGPGLTHPRPMTDPLGRGAGGNLSMATWSYVDRLKKLTKMKILIKGIDSGEDARLAYQSGADGVMISNHGGRSTETLRATIDCLPEVVDAVSGRIPVLVDGGFRRGADVYKALASGARAVGIGRPYIYGLATFGQPGVERVLELLRAELDLVMKQCGTPTIPQITPDHIKRI